MKRLWGLSTVALVAAVGCYELPRPALSDVASFKVDVGALYSVDDAGVRRELKVVTPCARKYDGGIAPAAVRGTPGCEYAIPRGDVQIEVTATAIDRGGQPATGWVGNPSFRVVPGDLTGDYTTRWAPAINGVAHGTVLVAHLYGAVKVWAEDAPPKLQYDGGVLAGTLSSLPPEPVAPNKRTYATGLSEPISFEQPTIQKVQQPDGLDNRSSPLVGEFLTLGQKPVQLQQSCPDDPDRDGKPLMMVVTGTDPTGFYVTDVTACRMIEDVGDPAMPSVRTPEPPEACLANGKPVEPGKSGTCAISKRTCATSGDCQRYLPGTFGSMFIYNFSFPDGLFEGDLLFTLSGAVQEFTGTTQLVFPAWSIADRVRQRPIDQWDTWLKLAPINDVTLRTCGTEDNGSPFLTEALCGHNRRNMKMESLESSLVRLKGVRFPRTFVNCNLNGDKNLPSFCEQKPMSTWQWGSCNFNDDGSVSPESPNEQAERTCNQDCVVGMNAYADTICAERDTFLGFGQFVVELAPPGLAEAGLDQSVPKRITDVPLTSTATTAPSTLYAPGSQLVVACTVPAKIGFGAEPVDPSSAAVTPANTPVLHLLGPTESGVAIQAATAPSPGAHCSVAINPRTRMSLSTKDALPELQPDCSETDSDAVAAEQCRFLHGATFDVVGHLKQVQAARPRWLVVPRSPDDLCCRPAPGQSCPKPVKTCSTAL